MIVEPHKKPLSLERGISKPGLDDLSIFGDAEKTISVSVTINMFESENQDQQKHFFLYKQLVQQEKMCIQALGLNRQTGTKFYGVLICPAYTVSRQKIPLGFYASLLIESRQDNQVHPEAPPL